MAGFGENLLETLENLGGSYADIRIAEVQAQSERERFTEQYPPGPAYTNTQEPGAWRNYAGNIVPASLVVPGLVGLAVYLIARS